MINLAFGKVIFILKFVLEKVFFLWSKRDEVERAIVVAKNLSEMTKDFKKDDEIVKTIEKALDIACLNLSQKQTDNLLDILDKDNKYLPKISVKKAFDKGIVVSKK